MPNPKNITNQRFGKLIAVRATAQRNQKQVAWECICSCGRTCYVGAYNLTSGHAQSCGCKTHDPRANRKDISGQRFGRLVALNPTGKVRYRNQSVEWRCLCDCGKTVFVPCTSLTSKTGTRSCGCSHFKAVKKLKKKYVPTPEKRAYHNMLRRCLAPTCPQYPSYGGRGITVCERWLGVDGFNHFLEDMGERPSSKHSIDRQNNNGNYEPKNCRWVLIDVQARNKRSNRYITALGETLTLSEWARKTGLKFETLSNRLHYMTPEVALTKPLGVHTKHLQHSNVE
jgi:hypothetical protein